MNKSTPHKQKISGIDVPPARTKAESADLIARLDKLVSESDTSQISNIQDYQSKHTNYMRQNYGRYVEQFEMFFCAMADYSHNINYLDKRAWPSTRGLQFIIATRSLKQFYSAHELLLNGVYEDAIALLRSNYESFLRIIFISCNPDYAANAYRYRGQSGPRFNATNLIENELTLDWNTYNITSVFAHSNMYNVMGDVDGIAKGQAKAINLDYELDDDMISMVINLMNFLLDIYLSAYDQLFTIDISKHKGKEVIQHHLDKLHEYALICHESLKSHSANEYWRKTAIDLEHIFELIKTMDADATLGWEDVWKDVRKA